MTGNLKLSDEGIIEGITYIPSPNFDERPDNAAIELLVIHNISLPPGEFGGHGVIELFTNQLDPTEHPYFETIKDLKVSSHFFIRRDGELIQFVPCSKRAWHAGVSKWEDRERCNDFSIGIELEGTDDTPFTDAQYRTLSELTLALKQYYAIKDIKGHSDIAQGRKTDPGPYFEWPRYLAAVSGESKKA